MVRDHVPLAREDIKVGLAKYNADYYKEEEHSIMANVSITTVPYADKKCCFKYNAGKKYISVPKL